MILLDTNVVSELLRPEPDGSVERWYLLHEDECRLPAVAIGELAFGIAKLADGKRKAGLASQLVEWRLRYAGRTLAYDGPVAMAYGDILADARAAGKPMSLPDAQIAATARIHAARLATRNTADFETTGLDLVDPWSRG